VNGKIGVHHPEFIKIISSFQLNRIQEARTNILKEKKIITSGKIIAELSFGFWTSLFYQKFEKLFGSNLDLLFPDALRTYDRGEQSAKSSMVLEN